MDKTRLYPVVYEIPGFGGDQFEALGAVRRNPTNVAGVEMLYVILDPNCRTGHHVFADSANNGPCGQALIEELIPYIEKTYRGKQDPRLHLLPAIRPAAGAVFGCRSRIRISSMVSGPPLPILSISAIFSRST